MIQKKSTDLTEIQVIGAGSIVLTCIFGLIGNGLSATVLSRVKWKSSVVITVIGLTICDSLVLLVELFYQWSRSFISVSFRRSMFPVIPWSLALLGIGQSGSVYFTTLISAERYIALCQPFKVRIWCTTRNTLCACTAVFALAILISIPGFLHFEVTKLYLNTSGLNLTDKESADAWQWSVREVPAFKYKPHRYLNYTLQTVFRFILPWTALVILNLLIYLQIRRSNKSRQEMSEQQQADVSIAKTLICVVLVFFISYVPSGIFYLEAALWGQASKTTLFVSELFIVLNAAVNFLIYVFLGKRFRDTLTQMLSKNLCFKYFVKAPTSSGPGNAIAMH